MSTIKIIYCGGSSVDTFSKAFELVGLGVSYIKCTFGVEIDHSEETWLSGKSLGCQLKDYELDPLTPTKITKRRYVLVFPGQTAPVYQCYTLGTF